MADSSLDDFFAKKDKSKKKTKSKTASEAPVQQNFSARKIKKKKDQEKQPSTTMAGGPKNNEEDQEWNDYEQETEKDYSGLRIQNLQIKNDDDDELENEFNLENDENNETGERRENNTGPWNKSGQSTTPVPTVVKVVEEEEEVEEASPTPSEEAPKNVGRYVPPAQRGQHASMTPTEARMARIRNSKKEAPNIHCEVDFPTLGGAVNEIEAKDFERVRGGTRNYEDPNNTSLQLKLNNKYRALQD